MKTAPYMVDNDGEIYITHVIGHISELENIINKNIQSWFQSATLPGAVENEIVTSASPSILPSNEYEDVLSLTKNLKKAGYSMLSISQLAGFRSNCLRTYLRREGRSKLNMKLAKTLIKLARDASNGKIHNHR